MFSCIHALDQSLPILKSGVRTPAPTLHWPLLVRLRVLGGAYRCLLAFLSSRALFQQLVSSIGQEPELAVLDAHEPVSKAATNACVYWIHPERLLVE
jgi:hypothetical protein